MNWSVGRNRGSVGSPPALAHAIGGKDAAFVAATTGPDPFPFLYLGAKHMVTGYDHLLFLVGVIFFLYRLEDVVQYVSLFTLGHSVTLLAGVLSGVHANRRRNWPGRVRVGIWRRHPATVDHGQIAQSQGDLDRTEASL